MNNLPKVVTQQRRGRASNPRLLDRKSDALPLSHRATPETSTETDTQEHVCQKQVRDVNELKQHIIKTWSATSRTPLIKRLISGKIVLMCVSKPKANTEHLL